MGRGGDHDDQIGRLARVFKRAQQPRPNEIRSNGHGLTSLPTIERSRHASSEIYSAGVSPVIRKRALTFGAGLVATALLAGVASVVLPMDGRAVARRDRSAKERPSYFVSPRNERSVYDSMGKVGRCANERVAAWYGDMRTGVLDRGGFNDDIKRIAQNIEDIRGHKFVHPVKTKIVQRGRVGKIAADRSSHRYSKKEAALDSKILAALGIVEPGTDMRKAFHEGASESIVGFYLPKKDKLYAGAQGGRFEPLDEIVLAHELQHALQDQALGIPKLDFKDPMQADASLATRALVEGDARLTEAYYMQAGLDFMEQYELWQSLNAYEGSGSNGMYVLGRAGAFPYVEGMSFVCGLFKTGGWAAVDRAFHRPPTSTAQVLFPGRYARDVQPVDAPDPRAPKGWKRVYRSSLGAAELLWMFQSADGETPSNPNDGIDRVRGWNGGEVHAYKHGKGLTVVITLVDGGMRTKKGRKYGLCSGMRRWYQDVYSSTSEVKQKQVRAVWRSNRGAAALACKKKMVRVVLSPSKSAAVAFARK